MRVLFITRKFPPSIGGMELFAHDLSAALRAKTDLKLVAWGGSGRIKAVFIAIPSLFFRATGILLRGGIDVIHAQDGVLAPIGYILSKIFRKPFVVIIHGLDITYKNPLFRALVPWAVRRAGAVICISEAAAQAAKAAGVPEEKLHVIPIAVNDDVYGKSDRVSLLKELDLPDNTKFLLTVGRLVKRKGVAWFIENVLPKLVKEYPELVYLVVGEGEERPNIESIIKRRSLERHARLLGKVSDTLRDAAYNGSDVFIMPNITVIGDMEGFGLVLLEASVCGLPAVAADTEGIRDAISDGQNGILVPVEDAGAFREAVNDFLSDSTHAKEFGKRSRAFTLSTYRWETLADRYIELYQKVLKR